MPSPLAPPGVPNVRLAPWATSRPPRLGAELASTTVSFVGMHTSAPLGGTAVGLQLSAVPQSEVPAPPVHVAVQVGVADAGDALASVAIPTAPNPVTAPTVRLKDPSPDRYRLGHPLYTFCPFAPVTAINQKESSNPLRFASIRLIT
jgi:hypothetical protein